MRGLTLAILLAALTVAAEVPDPLAGRWTIGSDGLTVEFRRAGSQGSYEVFWTDGPDASMQPGTRLGTVKTLGQEGAYDCTFTTDPVAGKKARRWQCVLRIDPDDTAAFTLTHYVKRLRADFWRMMPRWLRLNIREQDTRPDGIDGGRRVDAPERFIVL